jgi:MFS family permease
MKQGTSNVVSDNIEPDATVMNDEKTFHGEELAITGHHIYGFTSTEYELPKGYYWSSYFLGTFLATTLSQTSGTGTYVMMAAVINQINADIGPNSNIFWVFTVYTLSTAVGLLLFGRLTDLFGRRWFFISASLFGLVGSVVCATAQNIPTVIGGEVLIGLGATAGL